MASFATFGNDLYSGRRSINFVGRRKLWYSIGGSLVALSLLALATLGLNAGIEFRGGSEFIIPKVSTTSQRVGVDAVGSVVKGLETRVSVLSTVGGDSSIRVQTDKLSDTQVNQVQDALAKAYGTTSSKITTNFVGASWGSDVSNKAVQGLVVFLVFVTLLISLYFRTWKMAVAALVALLHDMLLTVGIYAVIGFEVTPATVIGLLTILGYSLYDTVVVFDKVRENTEHVAASTKRTYAEAANLAVNQTLVRSINTSVVALLPVASILFIGALLLGAGTLKDISLALFVGIAAGTYSSIFIATPLLVDLRRREPELAAQEQRVFKRRREAAHKDEQLATVGAGGQAEGVQFRKEPAVVGKAGGQRAQPRRGRTRR